VLRLRLSPREALEGGRIQVPTLDMPLSVAIPPDTTAGTRLRLKGQGILSRDGTRRGHQYIQVEVDAPPSALDALEAWVESNSARADVLPEGRVGLAQRVAEDLARGGE